MRALTCVLAVACVARKLRPCLTCSRHRDRINLGLCVAHTRGRGIFAWARSTTFGPLESKKGLSGQWAMDNICKENLSLLFCNDL